MGDGWHKRLPLVTSMALLAMGEGAVASMSNIEESIAFVLDRRRTRTVGMAFLVTDRLLLTCAHVVNAALGRSLRETARVPDSVRVPLNFALLGSTDDWFDLSARVTAWLPDSNPMDFDEDVAVLRLGQDLSHVGAVPLRIRTDPGGQRMEDVQMWGAGIGEHGRHVLGRLMGPVGKHRLQVDEYVQGAPRVGRGFSGGPAWYPSSGEVAGMLQATRGDDGTPEVYMLAGSVLERAVMTAMSRRPLVVIARDEGEVAYDGTTYSLRQSRLIVNHSPNTLASWEMKVSVNRALNDDPDVSSAYYRQHPLSVDELNVSAWCHRGNRREEMSCVPVKQRDAQIDFALYFAEGGELKPGQSAQIEYAYALSDRKWGQYYQRNVREGTDRLSIAAILPTDLEPECWGMTWRPSRTGLEPLPGVVRRVSGDETSYTWDRWVSEEDLQTGRRIRLDWFFWRRILDSGQALDASNVMAQFGILQVRNPVRRRKLPSHIPSGTRVRAVNLEMASERDLARRVLDHLRRVAGWVSRYHKFKPEVGMGIAAPQVGITYRIAIVRRLHSDQFLELINPRIVDQSSEVVDEYEGCFSFFDVRGLVRRPARITVVHDQLDGGSVATVLDGHMARNVQHEIDHLEGKIYTDRDRMPENSRLVPVHDRSSH